jgi:hypothetical protein
MLLSFAGALTFWQSYGLAYLNRQLVTQTNGATHEVKRHPASSIYSNEALNC